MLLREFDVCKSASVLHEMLEIMDKSHISSMLLERNKVKYQTPLMHWITHSKEAFWSTLFPAGGINWFDPECNDRLPIAKMLLDNDTTAAKDQLALGDELGNLPIHSAVTKKFPGLFQLMLEHRPDLLYWENAAGKTAVDLVANEWAHLIVGIHSPLRITPWINSASNNLIERDPITFVSSDIPAKFNDTNSHQLKIQKICQSFLGKTTGHRKLLTSEERDEISSIKDDTIGRYFFNDDWLFF
jgi:hypothetical protein